MIETILEKILNKEIPTETEVSALCSIVTDILINEPNISHIPSPVTIVGDIHGQFQDLLNMFRLYGTPKDHKFVFLGDIVDRGVESVETIICLLAYKSLYPENVYLIRGNHESKKISSIYGFFDEVHLKYGTSSVYRSITDVFQYFLLAVIVDGRYFCVHGGISSLYSGVDFFSKLQRFNLVPERQPTADLFWSDPGTKSGFEKNMRGTGHFYGHDMVQSFLMVNSLTSVVRSHQIAMEGYRYNFKDDTCITVWSAPNYCYRCGNLASVLSIDSSSQSEKKFRVYKHVPDQAPGHKFRSPFFDSE
ncbi:Serine/threonine specific protein phosphatase [Pseudoloma neurophilia]|uniref:Serine/threonine-protein phosphatase n=1 Tax=Pseudoloma neurophilia TaxID=146866 RepID=A0A0R0M2C6_9MICR|nr:Serine/threonine specific protein phosphatase [Pseudoloma neurophilia]